MHKCSIWKPDTENQTLRQGLSPMGKDCEVGKIIKFYKEIELFKEI